MAITETERFEMQLALRKVLGEEMGDRLMEHLPPVGWADVALSRDVQSVRNDVDSLRRDLDSLRRDFESFRDEMMRELAGIRNSIRVLTGAMITVSVAMMGMMIQLNLAIARL